MDPQDWRLYSLRLVNQGSQAGKLVATRRKRLVPPPISAEKRGVYADPNLDVYMVNNTDCNTTAS